MANHDLRSLLASLLTGDLTAALPLTDVLRETNDPRHIDFIRLVGVYLNRRRRVARGSIRMHAADAFDHFKMDLTDVFWPEIGVKLLEEYSGVPEVEDVQADESVSSTNAYYAPNQPAVMTEETARRIMERTETMVRGLERAGLSAAQRRRGITESESV